MKLQTGDVTASKCIECRISEYRDKGAFCSYLRREIKGKIPKDCPLPDCEVIECSEDVVWNHESYGGNDNTIKIL